MKHDRLRIQNFAQIADADITFGDLTVLVGAQGTGKSLALQWLKAAIDGRQVVEALRDAGHAVEDAHVLVDLIFGTGMGSAWVASDSDESEEHRELPSSVVFNGKAITPKKLGRVGDGKEKLFFVPAHRSVLISDGWAAPFQKLTAETPVVARIFSQSLFDRFRGKDAKTLFPVDKVLKKEIREKINAAVFHNGQVGIEEDSQHAKRLRLVHGKMHLPFMTWTAGQREFTPLLLSLYGLLPSVTKRKHPHVKWVVIEEPEMGLHPQAITAVMLLVLDLLWRGYKVVLSTHSPHVLTAVWMLQRLKEHKARWQLVCEAFGVRANQQMQQVAEAALTKDFKVHLMAFDNDDEMVRSKDISSLDPDDPNDAVSGWGGLTEFSSRFGDVVRKAVNESEV